MSCASRTEQDQAGRSVGVGGLVSDVCHLGTLIVLFWILFHLIYIFNMSGPIKKRAVNPLDNNPLQKPDDSESSHDEGSDVEGMPIQEHIQVDFEGRNPCDSDFHGIKQLLLQLFLKAHVDLSQLTDIIINQNYVGSVVKQSPNDENDDEEDDESDANDVFGVTSVINLTEKQNLECVQQLRTLLVELCDEHGNDQTITFVRNLLGDDSRSVGLLINERFVNIPAQIAVPLLGSLSKEIKKAKEKGMPYNFSYFIIICKLYKMDTSNKKSKKKKKSGKTASNEPEILWSNPEEELIAKEAECSFEFCVKKEADSGLSGQWMEDDAAMIPYRRVLLIPAAKLDNVIEQIKSFVG